MIAKHFDDYVKIIAVMNFRKNFPFKFRGIFANIFQRKIIPVYSSFTVEMDLIVVFP